MFRLHSTLIFFGLGFLPALSACSSGSRPQALPASLQSAEIGGRFSAPQIIVRAGTHGVRNAEECPRKKYVQCVTLSNSEPASITLDCSYCPPGTYWGGAVYRKNGKLFRALTSSFTPDPGNPITDTISERRQVKPSEGKVKYVQQYDFCIYSNCSNTFAIGIVTE